MADRKTCANCAAFAVVRRSDGTPRPTGECRRRAPILAEAEECFPPVWPGMWCLEHVARDSEAGVA